MQLLLVHCVVVDKVFHESEPRWVTWQPAAQVAEEGAEAVLREPVGAAAALLLVVLSVMLSGQEPATHQALDDLHGFSVLLPLLWHPECEVELHGPIVLRGIGRVPLRDREQVPIRPIVLGEEVGRSLSHDGSEARLRQLEALLAQAEGPMLLEWGGACVCRPSHIDIGSPVDSFRRVGPHSQDLSTRRWREVKRSCGTPDRDTYG